MSANVPAFSDIGKTAREILVGGKDGVFQYNQLVSISSKTNNGVEFVANSIKKGEKLETGLRAAYKHKNVNSSLTFSHLGKVTGSATFSDLAPGLSATLFGSVPDINTAKLGVDYSMPHLTFKSVFGLTSSPTVNASVTTGWNDLTIGGNAVFDTAKKQSLAAWTAGVGVRLSIWFVGYTAMDFQVAAMLADHGETLKVLGAHKIDPKQSLAGEIVRSLKKDDATVITLGYSKYLEDGSLAKVRLDNSGTINVLYEQEIQKNTKVSVSGLFDATNLDKSPKIGFAVNMKN